MGSALRLELLVNIEEGIDLSLLRIERCLFVAGVRVAFTLTALFVLATIRVLC